jgi:hypothetical protein
MLCREEVEADREVGAPEFSLTVACSRAGDRNDYPVRLGSMERSRAEQRSTPLDSCAITHVFR